MDARDQSFPAEALTTWKRDAEAATPKDASAQALNSEAPKAEAAMIKGQGVVGCETEPLPALACPAKVSRPDILLVI
jgi:hypothetical protein